MNILILNAGSSSHKSCLYAIGEILPNHPPPPLWQAQIDWQQSPPILTATGAGESVEVEMNSPDRADAVAQMLYTLHEGKTAVLANLEEIDAVGHRVVHGGQDYQASVWVDDGVKGAIARLIPLAPSHNPANLEGIQIIDRLLDNISYKIPQYAVFDTAFHSTLPEVVAQYPIPQSWSAQGIRRYGFHGISHQYCAHRVTQLLNNPTDLRLVTAHLGNGCSLAAIRNGRCLNTTMGFTPLDGLMMGTRSGSIDPGILLYLMRENGYAHEQLNHQLNKESGLKGVSGISGDMRQLTAAIEQGNAQAQLAIDMYIHHLSAGIAAMTASLGGLDALAFAGGVGENASLIRDRVCDSLAFLGIELSKQQDSSLMGDRIISTEHSKVSILVIHTQEEWQIAKEYWQLGAQP